MVLERCMAVGQVVVGACISIGAVGGCTYPIVKTCIDVSQLQVKADKAHADLWQMKADLARIMRKLKI